MLDELRGLIMAKLTSVDTNLSSTPMQINFVYGLADDIQALFLSQALDLIDQQVIKVWGGIKPSDKYAVSTEELKAAFQAKYGGDNGQQSGEG